MPRSKNSLFSISHTTCVGHIGIFSTPKELLGYSKKKTFQCSSESLLLSLFGTKTTKPLQHYLYIRVQLLFLGEQSLQHFFSDRYSNYFLDEEETFLPYKEDPKIKNPKKVILLN